MVAPHLLKLGWLVLSSKALAWPGFSRFSDNDGLLSDIVESAKKTPSAENRQPSGGTLSLQEGRLDRAPPADAYQKYLIHPSQDFSAVETDVRSSSQPGKQKDNTQGIDTAWKSKFDRGNPFEYEPMEWPLIGSNKQDAESRLFNHQAEAYHQPSKPPTAQTSYTSLPQAPWHEGPRFEDADVLREPIHSNWPLKPEPIFEHPINHPLHSSSWNWDASWPIASNFGTYHQPLKPPTAQTSYTSLLQAPWHEGPRFEDANVLREPIHSNWPLKPEPIFEHPINPPLHLSSSNWDASWPIASNSESFNDQHSSPFTEQSIAGPRFEQPTIESPKIHHEPSEAIEYSSANKQPVVEDYSDLFVDHDHSHTEMRNRNAYNLKRRKQIAKARQKGKLVIGQTDIPLDKIKQLISVSPFPKASMTDSFLESFADKFRLELQKNFQPHKVMQEKYAQHTIVGFPAVMIPRRRKQNEFIIRPHDNPDLQKLKRQQHASLTFKKLIRWLLFIDTAISREINGKLPEQDEKSSLRELIDWLWKEIFHPTEGSLPIFGMVRLNTPPAPGKAFGPVQTVVLNFLSKEISTENILRCCTEIIRIWNQKLNPMVAKLLWPDERVLNSNIKSIIFNALVWEMKIDNFERTTDEPIDHIGNFEIANLDFYFSKALQPKSFSRDQPVALGIHEQMIVDSYTESRSGYHVRMKQTPVGKLPLKFASAVLKDSSLPNKFIVLVTSRKGKSVNQEQMVLKLKCLFRHLQLCHLYLSSYLKDSPIRNSNEEFFAWLSKVFLHPGNHNYPIFGTLEMVETEETFNPKKFQDVQIYLIHYLSDPHSHSAIWQVSLALIGYWYKNEDMNYWIRYFNTDLNYWKTSIRILSEMNATKKPGKF
ncbi:hypothetical protein PGT21_010469 [Puccinia graminis f. sp. tritici]|uniref:Uncharacterized protein n=1 Tax=Puccinia graminis f. sp. tritici TaxID=56615 RepID=A0A5B0P6J9_PUCGR|nr:hypothetical protein PGT21_010469 [Puccinia graminis f. sp. tritici]